MLPRDFRSTTLLAGGLITLTSCSSPPRDVQLAPLDAGADRASPTLNAEETGVAIPSLQTQLPLAVAPNESSQPHVLEVHIEARIAPVEFTPGVHTAVWSYNGTVPGPLLHAQVGDRLIVHFRNSLPEETTIHWHGIRVPANMDGTPGTSQVPVPTGGTFDYTFTLPDAGLYWYHPHVDSAAQEGFGLYGAILVDDPAEPPGLGDSTVLVLSDLFTSGDGSLGDVDAGGNISQLFGREGNLILVNGKVAPKVVWPVGKRQRLRIVNAAKSRFFQVDFSPPQSVVRIGGDDGLRGTPISDTQTLVVPGGRADVVVEPRGAPGEMSTMRWVAYDRGYGSTFNRPPETLVQFHFADDGRPSPSPQRPLPSQLRDIPPLPLDAGVQQRIELTQSVVGLDWQLGINGKPFSESTPLIAHVGDTQIWTVANRTDWDHPFHLHGFFFQQLDAQGKISDPEYFDTLNIPQQSTRQIAIQFDGRPGMWMFHCHILDHAELGMMGMVDLR